MNFEIGDNITVKKDSKSFRNLIGVRCIVVHTDGYLKVVATGPLEDVFYPSSHEMEPLGSPMKKDNSQEELAKERKVSERRLRIIVRADKEIAQLKEQHERVLEENARYKELMKFEIGDSAS